MSKATEKGKRRNAPPDSPVFEFKFKRPRTKVVEKKEEGVDSASVCEGRKVGNPSMPAAPEGTGEDAGNQSIDLPLLQLTQTDFQKVAASIALAEFADLSSLQKLKTCMETLGSVQKDYFDTGRRKKRVPKDTNTRIMKEQVTALLEEFTRNVGDCPHLQALFKEKRNPKNKQLAKKEAKLQASIDNLEKEIEEWERIQNDGLDVSLFDAVETDMISEGVEKNEEDNKDEDDNIVGKEQTYSTEVDLFSFYEKLNGIRRAVQLAQRTEAAANDQREKVFILYESGAHRRNCLGASVDDGDKGSTMELNNNQNPKRLVQSLVAAR